MRKYWIAIILIIIAVLGFLTGVFLHRMNTTERNRGETTGEHERGINDTDLSTVAVNAREERIAPR